MRWKLLKDQWNFPVIFCEATNIRPIYYSSFLSFVFNLLFLLLKDNSIRLMLCSKALYNTGHLLLIRSLEGDDGVWERTEYLITIPLGNVGSIDETFLTNASNVLLWVAK